MNYYDLTNGLFEIFGGLFVLLSCVRIYKDKMSRGISFWHVGFFWSWGFWNLLFYPSVGATISTIGGVGVAAANSLWMAMIIYYRSRESKHGN